ncbi:MAG TPA: hypothetical protein VGQ16_10365 [Vicinamibacterales bacterium]|jgi:hypothetical protein|nr:hypothetical protein [Vicinamibacterales bacterium]
MAAGERQLFQLTRLNHGADHRRRALQQRRRGLHIHDLFDSADLEPDVERQALSDFEANVAVANALEPGELGRHDVGSRGQEVEDVDADGVRHHIPLQSRCGGLQLDRDTRQHAAAGIGDCAVQRGAARLRRQRRRAKQQ